MKFGPVALGEAEGVVLAHSLKLGASRLRKGRVLTGEDIARLEAAGISQVIAARLEPGDVAEDEAATRLAAALVPDPDASGLRLAGASTGRVNIHATRPGLLTFDAAAIHRLNRVDPMITLAALPPLTRVAPGQLTGTVKIIAYGVGGEALAAAEAAGAGALHVTPARLTSASLIVTEVEGRPEDADGKGPRAIGTRLKRLGADLAEIRIVPHQEAALAEAIAAAKGEIVLILTGSATSDPRDVAPAAVIRAGGQVARFGMPVDPGNLLFLGELGARPVIGLPGCARSPALNGADWVLERVVCGVQVSAGDIAGMGVGGLLKESPARPHPREGQSSY